ncbi:MAG: hypothetical protein M1816_000984 [Peltula sp. TS41687]|nr:MAG: hypothetical protein M1816_000984 [Peltula sp. TS41687]
MPAASHDNQSNHDLLNSTGTLHRQPDRSRLLPSWWKQGREADKGPQNRRIRHFHGLSLRNLRVVASAPKKTNDDYGRTTSSHSLLLGAKDDAYTKLESQSSHEAGVLADTTPSAKEDRLSNSSNGYAPQQKRPSLAHARKRRSTLIWAGKTPEVRQRKLEDVIGNSMPDTWFSLHCDDGVLEEPVYVSEVVPEAMNPNYRYFDLNAAGPLISRLDELTIKVWAKTKSMVNYELLVEQKVKLSCLQYLGKSVHIFFFSSPLDSSEETVLLTCPFKLEELHFQLPHNCLVLYLTDGIYTVRKSSTPLHQSPTPAPSSFEQHAKATIPDEFSKQASSYDALMRLSSLDECIQDALRTREKLASRINTILAEHKEHRDLTNQVSETKGSLASLGRYVAAEKKQLKLSQRTRTSQVENLKARREAISAGHLAHQRAREYLDGASVKLKACKLLIHKCSEEIQGQRRRICDDLTRIYPIEPILHQPPKSLRFTIRSLALPNSTFFSTSTSSSSTSSTSSSSSSSSSSTTVDETTISASLGSVSQLLHLLSLYLSLPLPYPLHPQLSTSVIQDPISSQLQGSRIFPLYSRGTVQFRFEYAVFLLNKNIESLLARQGVRVLDLRHTLPNLKYLLFVLSEGRKEVDDGPGSQRGGKERGGLGR